MFKCIYVIYHRLKLLEKLEKYLNLNGKCVEIFKEIIVLTCFIACFHYH